MAFKISPTGDKWEYKGAVTVTSVTLTNPTAEAVTVYLGTNEEDSDPSRMTFVVPAYTSMSFNFAGLEYNNGVTVYSSSVSIPYIVEYIAHGKVS